MRNTRKSGQILRSKKRPRPTLRSGRGSRTNFHTSHQIPAPVIEANNLHVKLCAGWGLSPSDLEQTPPAVEISGHQPSWLSPGRSVAGAAYAGLLFPTLVYAEKVRSQFLSLRHEAGPMFGTPRCTRELSRAAWRHPVSPFAHKSFGTR